MTAPAGKLSKEYIKSRMLRTASKLWGYTDTINENQFDPIVSMLFSAMASELENVQDDIYASQGRLLERLATMLLPDVFTAPQPSHCLLHATPVELKCIYKKHNHLLVKKNLPSVSSLDKEKTKDIFFTPAQDSILVNAEVKFIANAKYIYKTINAFEKEQVAENQAAYADETLSIWLGIDISSGIGNLMGANLFFDYKNEADRTKWYTMFDMCTATINDKYISLKKGIYKLPESTSSRLKNEQNIIQKLEHLVCDLYTPSFMHFDKVTPITKEDLMPYPPEFIESYSSSQLATFKDKLVWLKISYPSVLTNAQLPYINIALNCFPAINRKLNDTTYRLQDNLNILPLSVDDVYLDLIKIYSAKNLLYTEKEAGTDVFDAGTYSIRQGSIGRFDARNANEMLAYMMDLLREESASFSAMSTDILQNNLKQLNQLINAIQQKLQLDTKRKDVATYLMIEPQKQHENIYIEYWTTQGMHATNFKQGTSLASYKNSDLKSGSIYFVTNTSASKEAMSTNEAINTFKSSLLSRNRIVTEQDYIYASFAELGHLIEHVKVSTSYESTHDPSKGFIKCILIELTPAANRNIKVDWDYACKTLQLKLEQKSIHILPVEVIVAKAL